MQDLIRTGRTSADRLEIDPSRQDGKHPSDYKPANRSSPGRCGPEWSVRPARDDGIRSNASVTADWIRRSQDHCPERDRPGRRIQVDGYGAMLLGVTATGSYAFALLPCGRCGGENGIIFLAGSHARPLLAASEPSGAAPCDSAAMVTDCCSAKNLEEDTTYAPLRRPVLNCRF